MKRTHRDIQTVTGLVLCFFAVLVLLLVVPGCDGAGAGGGGGGGGTGPDDPDQPPAPIKPVARFTVAPDPDNVIVTIFEDLRFDASGSEDETGFGPIVEYRWSFAHSPGSSFIPARTTSQPVTNYMYRRYRDGGYVAALVVVNAAGMESDVFTKNMWIDDREGGIIAVD